MDGLRRRRPVVSGAILADAPSGHAADRDGGDEATIVRSRVGSGFVLLLPLALLAGIGLRLGPALPGAPIAGAGPVLPGTPDAQLETAATALEAATAKGASGYTFTVVSRSTLYAKPGGPLIEIPDPADPTVVAGLAEQYYLGASIAEGAASADGFWLQMRAGPATADGPPDFVTAPTTLAALVTGGVTYRDDGEGWYRTDRPPGIGLDPRTVVLLPTLLRDAANAAPAGAGVVDGRPTANLAADGAIADAPGLMAVDAASFTQLAGPIEFDLDEGGRLVQLRARMRNTRMDVFELIVETTITFTYPAAPPALPDPLPTAPPFPAPPPEPEATK